MPNEKYDAEGDIPVLDDLVLVDGPDDDLDDIPESPAVTASTGPAATPAEPQAARDTKPAVPTSPPASASFHFEMPSSKPLPRNNPFLPYEHLEQLARERIEFQKQFSQFAVAQPTPSSSAYSPNPYSSGTYKVAEPRAAWGGRAETPASSNGNAQQVYFDNLTRQLTQEVISELRPHIEKRIRELLEERLDHQGKR